jgi:hypothetical protein
MLRGLPFHGEILTMIVQSLRHAAWPALFACVSVVACSKKPATEDAFVAATVGPGTNNLCPVPVGTGVVTVGAMQASTEPMTVPVGEEGLSVDCSVHANGDGYDIQLSASTPGSQGGQLIVSGHVNADSGGMVSAQFASGPAGGTYTATGSCALTYTYLGQPIAAGHRITAGSIFAHISCTDAENQGGSVSGQQVMTADGGVSNAICDGEADFLFSNCSE